MGSHCVLAWFACSASLFACRTPSATPTLDRVERTPAIAGERPPPQLTGSRITATDRGALVIDADTGTLFDLDGNGQASAQLSIARGAGLLAYDPARRVVYVADRGGDHVIVVDTRDGLREIARWPTPAEPFGVALAPDGETLLVATIADRTLVALDTRSGAERWRVALSPGARTLAVAPDGRRALVASLAMGGLDHVELAGEHRVMPIGFDLACERCETVGAFARGTGSVTFIDAERAIATFQRSIPEALIPRRAGMYGGGSRPPVTQHLAFLSFPSDSDQDIGQSVAQIVENQPRSLAWDSVRDTFYVAGHGSDTLLQLPGLLRSSTDGVEQQASNAVLRASARCGPDGMTIAADGSVLVWCAFARRVLRLTGPRTGSLAEHGELIEAPELIASTLTPKQHHGLVLFYSTDHAVNRDRALACASCHLEGGADGLSWTIGAQALQTPVLAGRVAGTQPYKWDGSDPTLEASLKSTVARLGGAGLSAGQAAELVAYLQVLPRPRTPTLDRAAIARGRLVFEGEAGCSACHAAPAYTDGERHQFTSTLADADTPSLIGLAASAPYYHDGSAATLADVIAGRGAVHGMADISRLTAAQRADLAAFLASL